MSNYEILILTKMEVVEATVQKFLTETLKVKDLKIQKLENNELAYPIKKETHANYFLCNTKADPSLITELTRKLNIKKDFLRYLVINLDLEKGLKPKKNRPNRNWNKNKPHFTPRSNNPISNSNEQAAKTESNTKTVEQKEKPAKKVGKTSTKTTKKTDKE